MKGGVNLHSIIVEYDLCSSESDYEKLIEIIESYEKSAHITKSTWFIKTYDSCVEVRDNLRKYMHKEDRLFVGELNGVAAWRNVICKSDYLKNNL